MNFLEETIEAIKCSGHTEEDVDWVGSEDGKFAISWDEFVKIADVEYDEGFGSANIAVDLVVVFVDGTSMWRGEYDGSEWWEYSVPRKKAPDARPFKVVVGSLWPVLRRLNSDE